MVVQENGVYSNKFVTKAQQLLSEPSTQLITPSCCGQSDNSSDKGSSAGTSDDGNEEGNDDLSPSCQDDMLTGRMKGVKKQKKARGNWVGKLDFFLSCVGYAVGLSNMWRFPYLCYRNGGGAFMVPYFTFLILCGVPLFMIEVHFGQFANLGPIAVWRASPIFKGLGYGMVMISTLVCIYYNVIIAWTLYYIFQCVGSILPWESCNNPWNTANCVGRGGEFNVTPMINGSTGIENLTAVDGNATLVVLGKKVAASEEYWLHQVLQLTSGIDELGEVRVELLVCLFFAWVIVFFCLFKGIKTSGKVVYVTATFPYVVLFILLGYSLSLPGSWNGILFYINPRWELLKSFKVWGEAATQIFYSVGPAWGGVLTMASYNKYTHKCHRDAIIVPVINCLTSLLAGFVVFSVIGFMAHATGRPIADVVTQGPGLAFVVYPEAVTHLPIPTLWAILFFSMLFSTGLGSQFGMFECVISSLADEFPVLRTHKRSFTLATSCLLFLLGIPCVTQGGMYVLQVMDWYSAAFSLMLIAFLESVVIGWVYGADRFAEDIKLMTGHIIGPFWKIAWKYITPITILFVLFFSIIQHTPVTYGDTYQYPSWALGAGWVLVCMSLIPIFAVAFIEFRKADGKTQTEKLLNSLLPTQSWGPASSENWLIYKNSLALIPAGKDLKCLRRHVALSRKNCATNGNCEV